MSFAVYEGANVYACDKCVHAHICNYMHNVPPFLGVQHHSCILIETVVIF